MEFDILQQNALAFYPLNSKGPSDQFQFPIPLDEKERQEYYLSIDQFNQYSKSFSIWFTPGEKLPFDRFQWLLLVYMHSTNCQLRKYGREDTTIFKCYYHKKTKVNCKHYNGQCNFSLTIGKAKEQNKIFIISSSIEHNHVMCPKEDYQKLLFKANMCHLKTMIKEEIQDLIKKTQEAKSLEPMNKKFIDNGINVHNVHDKKKIDSVNPAEMLKPKALLESLQKTTKPLNMEVKLLLKELKSKEELRKKFSNMVSKIKKELLITGL